jgi:hypothetical protein
VELVHRGEVLHVECVRVFPGGAQRFEDPFGQVAATVVFAYQPVIAVVSHTFSSSSVPRRLLSGHILECRALRGYPGPICEGASCPPVGRDVRWVRLQERA